MFEVGDLVRVKQLHMGDGRSYSRNHYLSHGLVGVVKNKGYRVGGATYVVGSFINPGSGYLPLKRIENIVVSSSEIEPCKLEFKGFWGKLLNLYHTQAPNRNEELYLLCKKGSERYGRYFTCLPGALSVAEGRVGSDPDLIYIRCANAIGISGREKEFIDILLEPLKHLFTISVGENATLKIHSRNMNNYEFYLITMVFRTVYFYTPHVVDVYDCLKKQYPNINRLFLAFLSFSVIDFDYYGLESLYQSYSIKKYPLENLKSPSLIPITMNFISGARRTERHAYHISGIGSQIIGQVEAAINSPEEFFRGKENYYPVKPEYYYGYPNIQYLNSESEMSKAEETFFALLTDTTKKYYKL